MRKRKLIVLAVIVSILLVGGIAGGAILAADDNSDDAVGESQIASRPLAVLERACAIYQEQTGVPIDSEQLKDALHQARGELRDEALQARVQGLVDRGAITQEEADHYLEWWTSRPGIQLPLPGLAGHFHRGAVMWGRGPQP